MKILETGEDSTHTHGKNIPYSGGGGGGKGVNKNSMQMHRKNFFK